MRVSENLPSLLAIGATILATCSGHPATRLTVRGGDDEPSADVSHQEFSIDFAQDVSDAKDKEFDISQTVPKEWTQEELALFDNLTYFEDEAYSSTAAENNIERRWDVSSAIQSAKGFSSFFGAPLRRRNSMNMESMIEDKNKGSGNYYISPLSRAHYDAVILANTALRELDEVDKRLARKYFTLDEDALKRAKKVYRRIVGTNDDNTGGVILADIRPYPSKSVGYCREPLVKARMTPTVMSQMKGTAPLQLCPLFFDDKLLPQLSTVLAACRRSKPWKMSDRMDNKGATLLHEFTHFDPIGVTAWNTIDVRDEKTGKMRTLQQGRSVRDRAYGPKACRDLASPKVGCVLREGVSEDTCSVRAVENADTFAWFAMHAYMERNCGKNGARIKIKSA